MADPKPITLQLLTAVRERLLAAKIDPAQPVMAENLAHSIMEGSPSQKGGARARWLGRHAFSNAALANWQFDDCPELWTTLPKINAQGLIDGH
jgi:hypothetical protein